MTFLSATLVWFSLWLSGVPRAPIQTKAPQGLWLSDGYGLLVELNASDLRTYEVTSISCIPSRSAKRSEDGGSESPIIFRSGHGIINIISTDDPNVLHMRTDGTASDIVLNRLSGRPDSCKTVSRNTPQENYAIFWQTFAEQYPFFALRKVDWRAINKKFRREVTAATKPAELFQVFRQMIEPLRDSHTGLDAPDIKAEFDGWRNDPNHLEANEWTKAASIIESKYVRGGLRP
jgi:hypothetical protein